MSYIIDRINNMNIVFCIILIIILIYVTEIGAYIWHRWGTHSHIVPEIIGVQETHDKHHTDSEVTGGAADFFYVSILLSIFAILLFILSSITGLSHNICILIFLPVLIGFLWNWYIHDAYHTKNHWLSQYDWFIKDRQIHFEHHYKPNKNYGIASHFSDKILGTFANGKIKGRVTDHELYFHE